MAEERWWSEAQGEVTQPMVVRPHSVHHYSQPQHIQQRHSGKFGTRGDQISRALMHCGDRSPITLSIADFLFFGASKFRLVPGKC